MTQRYSCRSADLSRSQAFQPCAADFARAEGDAAVAPAADSGLTQAQKDKLVLEERLKANEKARAERRAAELTAARAVRRGAARVLRKARRGADQLARTRYAGS